MNFDGFPGELTPSSFEPMSESFSEGSNKSEGMRGIEDMRTEEDREDFRARRYRGCPPTSKMLKENPSSDDELPRLDGLMWEVHQTPPWYDMLLLGFLHSLVVLGNIMALMTTMVPIMGGGQKEKAALILDMLFICGINTLLHVLYGTRLPVVMGISYAYLIPIISIADSMRFIDGKPNPQMFEDTIREVQGALAAASLLPVFLSLVSRVVRYIWRVLDPITMIPMIMLTGFRLLDFGFQQTLPFMVRRRAPVLKNNRSLHWIFRVKYQIFQLYGILLSVVVLWPVSAVLSAAHIYDHNPQQIGCDARRTWLVDQHSSFKIPSPFHWGSPKLNMKYAAGFMSAAIVSMVESTATFIAASRYGGATWMPYTVLQRGLFLQGFSSVLNAMFGVAGSTASTENAGLLGFTRVGSRKVVMVAAGFMIFFSVIDVFGAFFASLPLSIVAGWFVMLNGCVVDVRTSFLQFCNHNSHRNMLVLGISLCMGVSIPASAHEVLFARSHGLLHAIPWVSITVLVFLSSQATVAAIIGVCLDLFIRRCKKTKIDAGHLWKKRFIDPQSANRTKRYPKWKWYREGNRQSDGSHKSGEFKLLARWKLNFPNLDEIESTQASMHSLASCLSLILRLGSSP